MKANANECQTMMDLGPITAHAAQAETKPTTADDLLIFRENAPDMDDAQILDFILTLTPSKSRASLAAGLLDTFGSLKAVLEARPEQLETVPGIGSKTARLIASFLPVMRAWQRRSSEAVARIDNAHAAADYCKSLLFGSRNEQFYVVCMNAQCQILGKRKISEGTLSEVAAYPRSVVETALNYNAHGVIICHNHPGGTCAPSREDIASTLQIQRILTGLSILVLDHIIVAGDATYSMMQHGDITMRT